MMEIYELILKNYKILFLKTNKTTIMKKYSSVITDLKF
jgi:hypothetical protein